VRHDRSGEESSDEPGTEGGRSVSKPLTDVHDGHIYSRAEEREAVYGRFCEDRIVKAVKSERRQTKALAIL
jgi:hypothetical protein